MIKKKTWRKKKDNEGNDRLDMERKYASAGPNKQMFEMYNGSVQNHQQ